MRRAPSSDISTPRYEQDPGSPPAGVFAGLEQAYPRAWAAMAAVVECMGRGDTRTTYRVQAGLPIPALPGEDELADVGRREDGHIVFESGRTSWTHLLDAVRVDPDDDVTDRVNATVSSRHYVVDEEFDEGFHEEPNRTTGAGQ